MQHSNQLHTLHLHVFSAQNHFCYKNYKLNYKTKLYLPLPQEVMFFHICVLVGWLVC